MNDTWPPKYKTAKACINEKFISIKSYSGYSLRISDYEASGFLLDPLVKEEELGQTLVMALNQSAK